MEVAPSLSLAGSVILSQSHEKVVVPYCYSMLVDHNTKSEGLSYFVGASLAAP